METATIDKKEKTDTNVTCFSCFNQQSETSLFGFSQQGDSHRLHDLPCQDYSGYRIVNQMFICGIADGVGQCKHAHIGAKRAVCAGLAYAESQTIPVDDDKEMHQLLIRMFEKAYEAIEDLTKDYPLSTLYSTLTFTIYDAQQCILYFIHAGDDGIVATNTFGNYKMVTKRHKGEEVNTVIPFEEKQWQVGKVKDCIAYIMATDGLLDAFVASEFENNRVYYPFMKHIIYKPLNNENDVKMHCEKWYNYMAGNEYRTRVNDDITMIAVVNQRAHQDAIEPYFDLNKWNQDTNAYQQQYFNALYDVHTPLKKKVAEVDQGIVIKHPQETDKKVKTKEDTMESIQNMKEKWNQELTIVKDKIEVIKEDEELKQEVENMKKQGVHFFQSMKKTMDVLSKNVRGNK